MTISGHLCPSGGEQDKISKFQKHEPISYFTSCKCSSQVKSNAVWVTMAVIKGIWKFMDGRFRRSFLGRGNKFILKISIPIKKKKHCPSYSGSDPMSSNFP